MRSSLGIGISSEGYPRRALHASAIASGTSSQRRTAAGARSTWHRKAGRVHRATLLGHGFRIGMLAELVRDGLAMPRRDIMRTGEREITVARRRLDRGRTEGARMIERIATSTITRRWPSARERVDVAGVVAPTSPHVAPALFLETASKGELEPRARAP
jgi:hypothetical protein